MQPGVRSRLVSLAVVLFAAGCSDNRGADIAEGDWRGSMREVRMTVRGAEDDPAMARRWEPFRDYLQEAIGLPVKFFEATDYNGTIQALASGQVDLGQMGGGSYANIDAQIGELAAPILVSRQAGGNVGYYSALLVRADSPYRSIDDLKGKTLGYVDFNSTSGYLYPRMKLREIGYDPDTFFGKTAFSGGHTQAVMALDRGQFDAVLINVSGGTPETGFTTGAHFTMADRGLMDLEDFRIVWSVGEIPNSPLVVRTDRPQEFIDLVRGAYAMIPYDDPDLLRDMAINDGSDYAAVNRHTYEDIIALRLADIAERRGGVAVAQSGAVAGGGAIAPGAGTPE
ncbi:phosphate/phosphite/phosphonate ABC transporter substrate-binding protein [bacterium]|nr:phosphate/phosphite/phosphonate ABC transporter substrate-binding protein [bacterium]